MNLYKISLKVGEYVFEENTKYVLARNIAEVANAYSEYSKIELMHKNIEVIKGIINEN